MNRLATVKRHETPCNIPAPARRADLPIPAPIKVPELTAQQHLAAAMIARGSSDFDVARELEINRVTVWRWRTNCPAFRDEVERWRRNFVEQIQGTMTAAVFSAIHELTRALGNGDPRIRLQAASAILRVIGTIPLASDSDSNELD